MNVAVCSVYSFYWYVVLFSEGLFQEIVTLTLEGQTVKDSSSSYEIVYIILLKNSLNPE